MSGQKVTDDVLRNLWEKTQSPVEISRILEMSVRNVTKRIRRLGIPPLPEGGHNNPQPFKELTGPEGRLHFDLQNGTILVASDCHFRKDERTVAFKAFLKLCKELRPSAVVLNGDVIDGAAISRHARIGWEARPTMRQELEAVEERLTEIEDACRTRNLYFLRGNHDMRVDTHLSAHASQFEGVPGFSLQDRYPLWKMGWSLWVTKDTVIKHRLRNSVHATYLNTLHAGKNMVTGHLHRLQATIFSDYNDRPRWGIDTGTLAEPYGPQFNTYLEDNPRNWTSGFAVLSWVDGVLTHPEFCVVLNGEAYFRGKRLALDSLAEPRSVATLAPR